MTIRGHWSGRQRGAALVLLATIFATTPAPGVTAFWLTDRPGSDVAERRDGVDHLYRIIGKVRFVVFWASADDVGGARITWRASDRDSIVSLLIGSEPQRAPRQVNEWGYIREEVTVIVATVFGIRTVTDGDSPEEAEARRPRAGHRQSRRLVSAVTPYEAGSRRQRFMCHAMRPTVMSIAYWTSRSNAAGSEPHAPPGGRRARVPDRTR